MRLIDADALLAKKWDWCDAEDAINDMPTVDAVPVVRCRDCKHAKPIPPEKHKVFYSDRVLVCNNWRGDYDMTHDISVTWKDGYCDEGERKEPADDL